MRRTPRGEGAASAAQPSGGTGLAQMLWSLEVGLVAAGILLPPVVESGGSASIFAPHDPERNWYILEPLVLAGGVAIAVGGLLAFRRIRATGRAGPTAATPDLAHPSAL